jgi:hypothetical protein
LQNYSGIRAYFGGIRAYMKAFPYGLLCFIAPVYRILITFSADFSVEINTPLYFIIDFCRHGKKHTISPTNVNFRANLWALKSLGCTHILVTTACGSLQEKKKPGDVVILDQFIDR